MEIDVVAGTITVGLETIGIAVVGMDCVVMASEVNVNLANALVS